MWMSEAAHIDVLFGEPLQTSEEGVERRVLLRSCDLLFFL